MLHHLSILSTFFFVCLLALLSEFARAEQISTVVPWIEDLRSSTGSDRLAAAYDYRKLTTVPEHEVAIDLYQGASDTNLYVRAHVVAALGELTTKAG
jgi:HEAT repeat protein